ncbi:MAG: hypothetical protein JHC54_04720 [Acinetobacter sp.]|nr:hypothetical protein [Acinetobacter sp.]
MRNIKNWVIEEIKYPLVKIYLFFYKNIFIFIIPTITFWSLILLLNPYLITPISKLPIYLEDPTFDIKRGRWTPLILVKDKKKYIANCVYLKSKNESFCEINQLKNIVKVEGEIINNKSVSKSNILIKKIIFQRTTSDDNFVFITDPNVSKRWDKSLVFPIYVIRFLLILSILFISFFVLKRRLNRQRC